MPRPPRLKQSAASTSQATYADAEEALEAGVENEERGERLAYGVKARRAYEAALDLYQLARRLSVSESDADATYNAARVLYVLASSFYMPGGTKETAFQQSIQLYRHAAERNTNTDFALDIASNLAVAMQGYIELCTDLAAGEVEQAQLVQMTSEAVGFLAQVAAEHEVVLRGQLEEEVRGGGAVEEGNMSIPTDSSDSDPNDATATASTSSTSQYSSSLIVPSSLLDAYLTSAALLTNLCSLVTSNGELTGIQTQLASLLEKAQSFVTQCNAANDWGQRASPDDDWERTVSELEKSTAEAQITVCGAMFDLWVRDAGIVSASMEFAPQVLAPAQDHLAVVQAQTGSKDVLVQQSSTLPESRRRAFWQIKVDEMISAAGGAVELSRLLLRVAGAAVSSSDASSTTTSPLRLSWSLATASSQLYTLIVSLLDTTSSGSAFASAAVLGSSQSANATTLLRCQVLTSLSDVSLLRSNVLYTHLASPPVVNAKSRATILDNARVYAKRALTDVGLAWTATINSEKDAQGIMKALAAPQVSAAMKPIASAKRDIPPGGWDAIQTQSEAILTLVRAIFTRAALYPNVAPDKTADVQASAQEELASLARAVNVLVNPANTNDEHEDAVARAWALALDSQRWLEALGQEEGQEMISPQEVAFWQQQWRREGTREQQ